MNYQSGSKEVLGSVERPFNLAIEAVQKSSYPVTIYERNAYLMDEVRKEISLLPPMTQELSPTIKTNVDEVFILDSSNRWINVFNSRKMMMKN